MSNIILNLNTCNPIDPLKVNFLHCFHEADNLRKSLPSVVIFLKKQNLFSFFCGKIYVFRKFYFVSTLHTNMLHVTSEIPASSLTIVICKVPGVKLRNLT